MVGRRPIVAFTIMAMTTVPPTASTSVTPMALSCSIHRPWPTTLAQVGLEVRVDVRGGEEAGHERAHRTADGVNTEGVERVVVLEDRLQLGAGQERHHAGEHADDDRARRVHEAGGGRDHDEAGDRARAEAEDGRLAAGDPLEQRPHAAGDRGGERRGHERVGGDAVGGDRAAGVEAVPADPQHAGADHGQRQAVRQEGALAEARALAEDQAEHQRRPTGRHVDDRAAREVDRLDLGGRRSRRRSSCRRRPTPCGPAGSRRRTSTAR